jgi:hypothetical protein
MSFYPLQGGARGPRPQPCCCAFEELSVGYSYPVFSFPILGTFREAVHCEPRVGSDR